MSEVNIEVEIVDDLPLLIEQQRMMGIAEIIDDTVGRHGNRTGLSLGNVVSGWLSYILSEGDHRLSYVEEWAEDHAKALSQIMQTEVTPQDFNDDRLGETLRVLSLDEVWSQIEQGLSQRIIRIYQLPQDVARVDTTTVSLYHDPERSELYAVGHSKDHRPDLAQIKVVFVTLDPLALPVVTTVLPGNRADDGVYIPAVTSARENLPHSGLLYVGDSKMEAMATRAHIAQQGDYYLLPLSQKGNNKESLFQAVSHLLEHKTELQSVFETDNHHENERLLAQGWERSDQCIWDGEARVEWEERQLLIYSPTLAKSRTEGLEKRIESASEKLRRLTPEPGRGKRQFSELDALEKAVDAILSKHKVTQYLTISYEKEVEERQVRGYGDRPARVEQQIRYQLHFSRNEAAIEDAQRYFGWRWYVTNAPFERLSLPQAVRIYRGGVATIERIFSRLKGRPLGLRPVHVRRDDHLVGLVRLLSLALRILTLIEFVVRRELNHNDEVLAGLYPGQASRTTSRPTTERLLRAFKGIKLSVVDLPGQHIRHITPLSPLQARILQLLKFSETIYSELTASPSIPP